MSNLAQHSRFAHESAPSKNDWQSIQTHFMCDCDMQTITVGLTCAFRKIFIMNLIDNNITKKSVQTSNAVDCNPALTKSLLYTVL